MLFIGYEIKTKFVQYWKLLYLIMSKKVYVYLKCREREFFHLLVRSLNGHRDLGWARPELWRFTGSHMSARISELLLLSKTY